MAEVTRQEFADMCAIDTDGLRVYISRKKVIVHGGGKLIDTTNPINKAFKDKRKLQAANKKETQDLISRIPVNPMKGKTGGGDSDDYEPEENAQPSMEALAALFAGGNGGRGGGFDGNNDMENMRKYINMKIKGDAELVTVKVEKEKILLAKAAGELLPIEVAMSAHKIYMRTIVTAFESGIMNIANKFCHIMAGGDMNMYTQIADECRKELDRCVKDAGGESNRDLELMIKEFTGVNRVSK